MAGFSVIPTHAQGWQRTLYQALLGKGIAPHEARGMTYRLLDHYAGYRHQDYVLNTPMVLPDKVVAQLGKAVEALGEHTPLQYLLGEAYFGGQRFLITPEVLIPRPETEEMVNYLLKEKPAGPFLDLCTGSGCIALTLKAFLPARAVEGWELSLPALACAQRNAEHLQLKVDWQQVDLLQARPLPRGRWGLIVSNPPYVPAGERASLAPHVLREPDLALFVPDEEPLCFYKVIGAFARERLLVPGLCCAEVHEHFGPAVAALWTEQGLKEARLHHDLHGKGRWVTAHA